MSIHEFSKCHWEHISIKHYVNFKGMDLFPNLTKNVQIFVAS